jgi:hypothetical protein
MLDRGEIDPEHPEEAICLGSAILVIQHQAVIPELLLDADWFVEAREEVALRGGQGMAATLGRKCARVVRGK